MSFIVIQRINRLLICTITRGHDPGDMYVSVELVARVIGESVEQVLAKDLEYRIRCLGARNFDGVEIYNSRILGKHFCLEAAESSHGYLL